MIILVVMCTNRTCHSTNRAGHGSNLVEEALGAVGVGAARLSSLGGGAANWERRLLSQRSPRVTRHWALLPTRCAMSTPRQEDSQSSSAQEPGLPDQSVSQSVQPASQPASQPAGRPRSRASRAEAGGGWG